MTWLLILVIIFSIIAIIIANMDKSKKILLGMCLGGCIFTFFWMSIDAYYPEAIDVYKGKTELKTDNPWYLEDSIVVWKKDIVRVK